MDELNLISLCEVMLINYFIGIVADWRNVVVVAGIDCADDNNTATCREFEIMGYPTLKLFPAHAPPLVVRFDGIIHIHRSCCAE